jgi:hypothetical protein
MWHSVFPRNPDECLFNLWIDNGMITRLIPYETEARPYYWRYQFRHVFKYRDYRFLMDDALRSHRIICGPLVEYPVVPQHVLSPANQSIHVPIFSFYAVWYRASNSWRADAIFTGWSTDLQEYIIMDWIPEYANRMDIPSVDEFSMTLYSGPIGDRGRIPFPDLQNVTNFYRMPTRSVLEGWPVLHRMSELDDMIQYIPDEEEEECKIEHSFDNDAMDVTCAGVEECKGDSPTVNGVPEVPELTLDAIYQHDDGDETRSLIWVQCRICKWSSPVESYVDGNCLCNWDQEAALEEKMARLS